MLNIGCHLSSSKGFRHMGKEAQKLNANTFQFFTRNPRGSKAKPWDPKDVAGLLELMEQNGFAKLVAHAPYTLNPCSADPSIREFAHMVMAEDLENMEMLPHQFYNFHPGSHVGQGVEAGIQWIVSLLNATLRPDQTTLFLLETMSGKGSEVGRSFEELKAILDGVHHAEKMGICLDTCHVYSAGYDIVNNLDGVLEEFDRILGLDCLKAIHLNDSLTPFHSHKDRHAKIGEGSIGLEATVRLINHPQLRHLPFLLETPNELPGYAQEIQLLRNAYQE